MPMSSARGRRVVLLLCGVVAVTAAGCADLDFLPSWVPFQGPASDHLDGVVTSQERIERLRKLAVAAAYAKPDEKLRTSEQLAAAIRTEKDPLIRLEIIRTLGHYPGPAADAILKAATSDTDAQVRTTACEAWGRRGDAQAIELLSEMLRGDADVDVRLAAAKALGETRNPAAVAPLGDALCAPDSDPAMQYRAVLSLQQVTGKKELGDNVQRWQLYVRGELPTDSTPTLSEQLRRLF
jgi:HEAT repeat protein